MTVLLLNYAHRLAVAHLAGVPSLVAHCRKSATSRSRLIAPIHSSTWRANWPMQRAVTG
jgi:hypothetical protein